ncbi:hypothetical protein E0Z10_g9710 [Xylaria hypoxylon]|uniref:NACHT domain-containing protein n=1 Tax=Xylaria hypoxylon TaxID=37992 RepID=A0A4Z0YK30_9PEZI|nr:hypothetical protein E0Z10_g9710 [Xylaria hypoxylon]
MEVVGLTSSIAGLLDLSLRAIALLKQRGSPRIEESTIIQLKHLQVLVDNYISEIDNGAYDTVYGIRSTTREQLSSECRNLGIAVKDLLEFHRTIAKSRSVIRPLRLAVNQPQLQEFQDRIEKHRANVQLILQISLLQRPVEQQFQISETLEDIVPSVGVGPTEQILDQAAAADQLLVRTGEVTQEIEAVREKTNELQIQQKIHESLLKWLSFAAMHRRLEEIPQTYGSTFEWIFEQDLGNDDYSNFRKWLQEPRSGLYWVKGREGSGKSTLMKYIWQSPNTRKYLEQWQGSSELVTAAFSLWKVGSSLAKSQAGLLRSLLYTLLSQKPDLIPLAFSHYWSLLYRRMQDATQDPSRLNPPLVSDLVRALRKLIDSRGDSLKIFLLVDGLDEFEGDINAIVQLCKDIASSSNVKMVCSSREIGYEVFIQAFSGSPTLQLENMNTADIETFVKGSLESTGDVVIGETDRAELARDITKRSEGLFIWASLVVTSLVQGPLEGDLLGLLRRRLKERPDGLTGLYDQLFRDIPNEQKKYTSKILQILLEWSSVQTLYTSESQGLDSIPLLDLCLADGKMTEVLSDVPVSKDEIAANCKNMEMRLQTQCSDFIEVRRMRRGGSNVERSQLRVEFSHRTVLDHFDLRRARLREFTKVTDLNPSLSLLKSVVHRLQILDVPESRQAIWDFAVAGFVYANNVESVLANQPQIDPIEEADVRVGQLNGPNDQGEANPENPEAEVNREAEKASQDANNYIKLLTELDKSMQKHHEKLLKTGDDWITRTYLFGSRTRKDKGWQSKQLARVHWSNFHPTISQPLSWRSDFLSLAVQFGLLRYLSHRLDEDSKAVRAKKGRPVLEYALCPLDSLNHDLMSVEVVQKLLDNGARPKYRFEGRTCWQNTLEWENTYFKTFTGNASPIETEHRAKLRLKIFSLLLRNGADPLVRCSLETRDVPFEEFLNKYFHQHDGEDLDAVKAIVSKANDEKDRSWKNWFTNLL